MRSARAGGGRPACVLVDPSPSCSRRQRGSPSRSCSCWSRWCPQRPAMSKQWNTACKWHGKPGTRPGPSSANTEFPCVPERACCSQWSGRPALGALSLESLDVSKMITGMTWVARRPHEMPPDYLRRRERVVSGIISRHFPSKWGRTQRFMFVCFSGHIARQDPVIQRAAAALRWRSTLWWSKYRQTLPAKTGGQRGRRPAHSGPICRSDKPQADAYAMARCTAALPCLDVPSRWVFFEGVFPVGSLAALFVSAAADVL